MGEDDLDDPDDDDAPADGAGQRRREEKRGASALDILDGMAAHYREKRLDLLRWPWPFFAAQWARMIDAETRRMLRERRREERRADVAEQRRLEAALRGGG